MMEFLEITLSFIFLIAAGAFSVAFIFVLFYIDDIIDYIKLKLMQIGTDYCNSLTLDMVIQSFLWHAALFFCYVLYVIRFVLVLWLILSFIKSFFQDE